MHKIGIRKAAALFAAFSMLLSSFPSAAGEENAPAAQDASGDTSTSITYGPGLYSLNEDGTLSAVDDGEKVEPRLDMDLTNIVPVPKYTEDADGSEFISLEEYTREQEKLPSYNEQQGIMPAAALSGGAGRTSLGTNIASTAYTGSVTKNGYYYLGASGTNQANTFFFNGVNINCTGNYDCALQVYSSGNAFVEFLGACYITKTGYTGSAASAIKSTGGTVIIDINESLTINVTGAETNYAVYKTAGNCTLKIMSAGSWLQTNNIKCYGLNAFYDPNITYITITPKKEYTDADKIDGNIILPVGSSIDFTGVITSGMGDRYTLWGNDGITYKVTRTDRASVTSSGFDGTVTGLAPGVVNVTSVANAQDPDSTVDGNSIGLVVGQAVAPRNMSATRVDKSTIKLQWSDAFVDYGDNNSEVVTGYEIYYSKEHITDENIDDPEAVTKIEVESSALSGEHTFSDLEPGEFYYFRIKTKSRIFGISDLSEEAYAHLYIDPTAPTDVKAARVSDTAIDVSWSGAGGTNIIGYRVYYNVGEMPDADSVYKEIFTKEEYDRLHPASPSPTQAAPSPEPSDAPEVMFADDYWETGEGKLTIEDSSIVPQRDYYIKVETITRPIPEQEEMLLYSGLSDAYASVYMYKSPEAPEILTAERVDDTTAHLKWEGAAGDEIYGYRLYYYKDSNLVIPFDSTLAFFDNAAAQGRTAPEPNGISQIALEEDMPEDSVFNINEDPSILFEVPKIQKDPEMEKLNYNSKNQDLTEVDGSEFINIASYEGAYDPGDGNTAYSEPEPQSGDVAMDGDGKLTHNLPTNTYATAYTGSWVSTHNNYMKLTTAGNYYFNGVNITGDGGDYYGTILFSNKGTANLYFYGNNVISRAESDLEKASAIYVNSGGTVNIYNYGVLTLNTSGNYAIYDNDGTVNLLANRITTDKSYYGQINDKSAAPPSAPTSISAKKTGATSALVEWKNGDGGSYNIYGYRIYYSSSGEPTTDSEYVSVKMLEHKDGSCTVEGLTPQKTYNFKIVTVTTAASSPISTAMGTASLDVTAGAPQTVKASKENATSARVEWSGAQLAENDGRITGYRIYYDKNVPTDESDYIEVKSNNETSGSAVVKDLETSTVYYFKVMTISMYADSEISEQYDSADLTVHIAPPSVIEATREDSAIRVDWRNPELEEGVITKYRVYYSAGSEPTESSDYVDVETSSGTAMAVIENLSKAKYYIKIQVFSTYITSGLSKSDMVDLSIDVLAPKIITAVREDENSASLSWSGASAGGGNISSYLIYYDTEIPTQDSPSITVPANGETGGTTIVSGTGGQINYYRIATVADNGTSSLSSVYASAFLFKGTSIAPGSTIDMKDGNVYRLDEDGEYTVSGGEFSDAAIQVADGVEAVLNINGDLTVDNSASSDYEQSPVSIGGNAKLTININGNVNFYGSPAGSGSTNTVNGTGGTGGFAGVEVPRSASLIIAGAGDFKAYGGDAGDGGNSIRNNDIGGAGGGGAGAGIGGNGGNGGAANTPEVVSTAENGSDGGDCGYVHIVGAVNVYAYGGSGGSGGYMINGDAGGGGGYPAAGIGGGGAGGGGATTTNGGGGFSGGTGEYETVPGKGFSSMTDGTGDSNVLAGSGYFSGGNIGGLGQNGAGTGGAGGKGGTVFADTSIGKINAYNGNYITSLDSGANGNGWGENPTPIYAQLGYNISTVRSAGLPEAEGRTAEALITELGGYAPVEYTYNNIVGIGSGAGYTEADNGVYAPYVFNPNFRTFGEQDMTELESMNLWHFRAQTSSKNGLSVVSEAEASAYLFVMPYPPTEIASEWETPTAVRLTWSGARGAGIDRYYIYYTTDPTERVERWNISNEVGVESGGSKPSEVPADDIFAGDTFIILYNPDPAQQYKLLDDLGHDVRGQIWKSADGSDMLVFDGIEPNTGYRLVTRYAETDEGIPSGHTDGVSIITRQEIIPPAPVEPEETEEPGEPSAAEEPEEPDHIDYVLNGTPDAVEMSAAAVYDTAVEIYPAYYGSEYQLLTEAGDAVVQSGSDGVGLYVDSWVRPDGENRVEFTGLSPETTYKLVTRYRAMGGRAASADSGSITLITLAEGEGVRPEPEEPEPDDSISVEPVRIDSESGEAIVRGLVSNETYYFKIASGSVYQDKSEPSEVTAHTYLFAMPDAPVVDKVVPGNGKLTIHHIRTADSHGSPIQYYNIKVYRDKACEQLETTFQVDANSGDDLKLDDVEIPNLTNGTEYTVFVTAVNGAGESKPSNTLSVIAGSPCAPDPFRVHSGENRLLNVKYGASEDNGFPVTHYNIYVDGEFYTTNETLTYEFEGKYYGDLHTFEVSGVNQWGEGPKTEAVSRSIGAPSTAMVNNIVYYSDGSDYEPDSTDPTGIDVSWDPANGNGEVIQRYTLYLSEKGEDNEVAFEVDVDPSTKLIDTNVHIPAFVMQGDKKVTYLKYGQEYNIEIEAESIAGIGSRSEPYYFTYGAPSAPIITMAHGADEIITTMFISTEGNGADVLYFNIYVDGELYAEHVEAPPVVVEKLANGVEYTIEATAVNRFGESSKSKPVKATPGRQPSEPRNVQATAISGTEVALSWEPPINSGGYDILSYYVAGYIANKEQDETNQDDSKYITCDIRINDDNTAVISGLENGTTYEFEVFAVTESNTGYVGLSNEVTTFATPEPPVITKAISTAERVANPPVTVWWDPPVGDDSVESYNVYLYEAATDSYSKINDRPITDTAYTFTHERMTRRNTYEIAVTAVNSVGESNKSERVSILMGAPYAPENPAVTTDNTTAYLTWQMPDMDTCYVEGYRVYLDEDLTRAKVRIDDPSEMECALRGLQTGKAYTAYIKSFNDVGSSPFSEPVKFTVGAAQPPQITNVKAGYELAVLNWTQPEEKESITDYIIYAECGGVKKKVDSGDIARNEDNTQATITNLEGGKRYTFTITSECKIYTGDGDNYITAESVESGGVSATPWTKPDAPAIDKYSVIAGDGEFSFSFDKPETYGLDISKYEVYVDGVKTENCSIGDGTVEVHGVTNGFTGDNHYGHRFYMLAYTKSPEEDPAEYVSDTPPEEEWVEVTTGLPQKAVIDGVSPGDEEITISYSVPNESKIDITGYEIVYSANGVENTITASSKTETLTGLENGVQYTIKVRGKSAWGDGPYSDEITASPGTAAAPEITTARSGDSSAYLEWSVPDSPLSDIYKYNIYIDGELAYESNKTSMTIANLVNGTSYSFTVAAVNEYGAGTKSKPVTVTPGKVPGVIERADLTALSDTEVEIEWLEPLDKGGHDVSGYIVTGKGIPAENIDVDSKKRTAKVTGLTPGTWYSFEITAENETGRGETYYTDSVRTMIEPGAPIIEKLSSVNDTITVRWLPPEDEGGTPVLGYNVYVNGKKINKEMLDGPEYTIESGDGLEISSGSEYAVTVSAVNKIGEGVQSSEMYITAVGYLAPTVPGKPRDVQAIPGDSRVTVEWVNPAYDGNDDITEYYVYAGTSEDVIAFRGKTDGATYTFTVPNLNNGTPYVFAVRAKNSKGESEFSDYVWASPGKLNIPQAPSGLAYFNDTAMENMTVTWNAVQGDDIIYRVYVNGEYIETSDTQYTMPVGGGKKYSIQVSAVNSVGEAVSQYIYACNDLNVLDGDGQLTRLDANYDGELDDKIIYSAPYAPENVRYEYDINSDEIQIYWTAPFDGNNPITGYSIFVNGEEFTTIGVDGNGMPTNPGDKLVYENGTYIYTHTVTHETPYSVQIAGVNGYGTGDKSKAILVYVEILDYPSGVTAKRENPDTEPEDITVEWRIPDETDDLEGFAVYINGVEHILYEISDSHADGYSYDPATRRCTYHYTQAEPESDYIFRVAAVHHDMTKSRVSNAARVYTDLESPDAPQWAEEPITEADGGSIKLRWIAPESDITHYLLYVNGEQEARIDAADTEYTFTPEAGRYYIFRVSAVNGTAESEKSDRLDYSTIDAEETAPDAPLKPRDLDVRFVYSESGDGSIAPQDNMIITWKAAGHDDSYPDADGYQIYINGSAVPGVVINAGDGQMNEVGDIVYTYTYTAEEAEEYGIYVKAFALRDEERVFGPKSDTVFVTAPTVALEVPSITGVYNAESGTITLGWNEIPNAEYYYLYVNGSILMGSNGAASKLYGTSYTMDAEPNHDYAFNVMAARGAGDIRSGKSKTCFISTYDDSGVPSEAAGAPRIVRSVSDYSSKVTIYWTAPEENADNIFGYYVIRAGEQLDDVMISAAEKTAYGEYKYTFTDIPEDKAVPVAVVAFERYNGQDFIGNYSNIWNIKLELNISEDFGNDNPSVFDSVSRKDADGDGLVDEIGATATLTGVIDAGGAIATITVKDRFGSRLASVIARSNFRIDVPLSTDSTERYMLEVTRDNYTSYVISDMDLNDSDTRAIYFDNLTIYAGDVNADDYIGLDDLSIVNSNYGDQGAQGDVNADGRVNVDDLSYVNMNYGKRSVKQTLSEYKASKN